MSTSAPPPASPSVKRTLKPWYLLATMAIAWLLGVLGLSSSLNTLLFLHEGKLPDVQGLIHGLERSGEPVEAILNVWNAARFRPLGEMVQLAFPLFAGKLILSVLMVITSGMAMSGRPGSRMVAMQALLANIALSVAMFWLLRDARYAWGDTVAQVHPLIPSLLSNEPPRIVAFFSSLVDKPVVLSMQRMSLFVFDVGALLLGVIALTTNETKAFFEAIAAKAEEAEEP